MKLLTLTCAGVRGLPDGSYSFTEVRTGAPLAVAIVTGGPASGKTSLLELIAAAKEAVGSYGSPPNGMRLVRAGAGAGHIQATWLLSEVEQRQAGLDDPRQAIAWELVGGSLRAEADSRLRRLFARYSRRPEYGKLEYFPANRRLLPGLRSAAAMPVSGEGEVKVRATKDADKYTGLLDVLRDLAREDAAAGSGVIAEEGVVLRSRLPRRIQPYQDAVAVVLPDLRLERVDARGALRFARREGPCVGPDDLSESEQQGVLFALAFRYFGLAGSLVLIDEPELHVHAADRVRFLQALVELGRDNQIIVATGSTEIANVAAPGQVIDLSRRSNAASLSLASGGEDRASP